MKDKEKNNQSKHPTGRFNNTSSKDTLSQDDLKNRINTVSPAVGPRAALETPDGKNNGAEPEVFKNQRKSHT
jgi:hypothetical protein